MRKVGIILGIFLSVFILGCKEEVEENPKLMVVNKNTNYSIVSVRLVGYTFSNIDIAKNGGTKTFELNNGIAGGYNDVNVTVIYGLSQSATWNASNTYNFADGKTTAVTLNGNKLQ